uniref:J domain-containing protein n=1 Tax=Plectus sambesii TaxID=2011161 RepID=A0A914VPS3_9BILA
MAQFSNDAEEDGTGGEDYYAMLNVPRNASTEDINRAFRQRSRVFHPDRHMDEDDKKEAERVFVRLRNAHEALIDPHKRAIYDSVGPKGLNVAGWDLIAKTYNTEDIKREYEFLRRLKDAETMMDRVQPTSTFSIKTNATDLFRSNEYERNWPEIVAMSMSQSVDCAVTTDDRVTLRGHLKTTNGRGGGGMTVGWRRPITDRFSAEGELSFEEAPIVALKLSRSFSKYIVAIQPMTILHLDALSLRDAFEPGVGLVFTAQLSQRWRGTLMLRLGHQQSISTTIFYLDLNQPKFIGGLTITPALATSNIRLSYTHRVSENEALYRTTAAFGLFGVMSSVTYERRLTRHSRISCSIRASLPAGSLQTKFR